MNLFRFDILSLAARIGAVSTYRLRKYLCRRGHANRTTGQFKVIVTAVDFNTETTFELF